MFPFFCAELVSGEGCGEHRRGRLCVYQRIRKCLPSRPRRSRRQSAARGCRSSGKCRLGYRERARRRPDSPYHRALAPPPPKIPLFFSHQYLFLLMFTIFFLRWKKMRLGGGDAAQSHAYFPRRVRSLSDMQLQYRWRPLRSTFDYLSVFALLSRVPCSQIYFISLADLWLHRATPHNSILSFISIITYIGSELKSFISCSLFLREELDSVLLSKNWSDGCEN